MKTKFLRMTSRFSQFSRFMILFAPLALIPIEFAYAYPALVSDDFEISVLNAHLWTVVDPLGDGIVTLNGTQLLITVPAGVSHDVWTSGNRVPQVQQAIANEDLFATVKFSSAVSAQYQQQGVLVQADPSNLVRIEIHSTGSQTRIFAATFLNGVPTTQLLKNIQIDTPHYLRVIRTGDQWTVAYSSDGTNWLTGGSFPYALAVTTFGIFAGNSGGYQAHTAVVDYLSTSFYPPPPQSDQDTEQLHTLAVRVEGSGHVVREPDAPTYATGDEVTLTAVPNPGHQFQEWRGATWGDTPSVTIPLSGDVDVTAVFSVSQDTVPPVMQNVNVRASDTTAMVSWTTNEDATSAVSYGLTSAYELGTVSDVTLGLAHSLTLNGLQPGGQYHYQMTSTDRAGNTSDSIDMILVTQIGDIALPKLDIWYGSYQKFGYVGTPQQWVNVLGSIFEPENIVSLSYSLNGGPQQPLSIGADGRRLAMSGDFNVEMSRSDLAEGLNQLVITATDRTGQIDITKVDVAFSRAPIWPATYSINWQNISNIQDVVEVVDGKWRLDGDGIRTDQPGYDRLVAIGDVDSWDYFEIQTAVTIHAIPQNPTYHGYGVGILSGWSGHTHLPVYCAQPHCGWQPSGPTAWWFNGDVSLGSRVDSTLDLQLGVRYNWKFQVKPSRGRALYSFKVWPDGTPEPATWNLQSSKSTLVPGSLLLVAHDVDVTFGNVHITPIAGP